MDIICPPLVERAHRVCRAWQKAACRQSFAEARAEGRRQHLGQSASSMAASTPHPAFADPIDNPDPLRVDHLEEFALRPLAQSSGPTYFFGVARVNAAGAGWLQWIVQA